MAGLIPQSFIDDLLSRADIVDVVGASVTLRKTGKNYSGLCPFHQEKTPSFSVEPDKQFYYCFGCGKGGNAIGFVMDYENIEYPQAIESLANSMGLEVPREESAQLQQKREKSLELYDILLKASSYYQQQLRHHPDKNSVIKYLKDRGLSGEIARDFKLGFAPPGWQNLLERLGSTADSKKNLLDAGFLIENPENKRNPVYDRFRNRIMFPIRDQRGRVIAFGGRVIGDDKPKYLNSPETPVFHKGEELYGLYEAKQKVRKLERILIVEGYMDVIALAQNDINYCVATLGTATSTAHLKRLFKLVPEIVFCFDGDQAGRDAAWRALQQALPLMEDGRSARFLFLPDGEDPDSQVRKIGSKAFINSISEATQLAEFFFENLCSQVDMESLEGRAKLGTIAMPLIKLFPDGLLRRLILDQLAKTTGVDLNTLSKMSGANASAKDSHPYAPKQAPSEPTVPVKEHPDNSIPKARSKSTHSACKKAVNLILLKPEIVSKIEVDKSIKQLKSNDIDLLFEVIDLAKSFPSNSTHELLGRVYDTPIGSQLIQLQDREQITPATGIENEFKEIMQYLAKIAEREALIAKGKQTFAAKNQ
ncbi:DNA primase [Gammaproteobacteria bacterium]|nr:DNA primase [Gammaproteobacteria bacterium]